MIGYLQSAKQGLQSWWRQNPWMHIYLFPLLFFIITAIFALSLHFEFPYMDHWDLVRIYERMEDGSLKWADLFELHGSHWHTSAYVVLLAIAKITGLNHDWEIVASLGFAFVGFIGLFRIIQRSTELLDAGNVFPWLLGVSALIWWSLDQSANWLWGWQVAVFINTAGAIWSINFLTQRHLTALATIGAGISATIAILAFGTGLALLPIGLAILLVRWSAKEFKLNKTLLCFFGWVVFSGAVVWIYLGMPNGDPMTMDVENKVTGLEAVILHLTFITNYIASPVVRFASNLTIPLLVIIGVGLTLIARKTPIKAETIFPLLPFLAFIIYALGAASLTSFGRAAELGPDQAFVSRYISFGNFLWLGLVGLFFLTTKGLSQVTFPRHILPTLFALFVTLKIGNCVNVGNNYFEHKLERSESLRVIVTTAPQVDEDALSYFAAEHQNIDNEIAFLKGHNMSLFRKQNIGAPLH
ncbi:hypothetical protein ABFZ85_04460 [Hyphococcus formosus]|uniref:hypothetical protein n=1 Tax=Hyphococcus formosus TaxID=3143534 RepID=UPI00398A8347